MHDRMCNLKVTTKRGTCYEQNNLILSDIIINSDGVCVSTELGITTYHTPNIERTEITFIEVND